jgi:hypothetical protein
VGLDEPHRIEHRIRQLNDLGFAVDEVRLETAGIGPGQVRVHVAVAERRFHSEQLRALTGLDVGEGQATILLNDLRAQQSRMQQEQGREVPEHLAARHWLLERFTPGVEAAHAAVGGRGDPVQAFCDQLDAAAASMAFVDTATREVPVVRAPNAAG